MTSISGIGQFEATDARDHETWSRIAAFVAQHGQQAFSRDPQIGGHVTASAFVLSPDRQAVLLTHHRKLNIWIQLGGHCDGIRDAAFVALKEAYEESGLPRITPLSPRVFDIDIHPIPANPAEPAHLHHDIRYLLQAEDTAFTVSDESHALAWVPLTGLEAFSSEASVLRMRDKALADHSR